jgi:hypothetical protein
VMGLMQPPEAVQGMAQMGYPEHLGRPIAILALTCVALYVIPKTAVLGAIMMTAYFGAATATHLRVEDPFFIPVVMGILAWLGLYLREPRLQELVPLRK